MNIGTIDKPLALPMPTLKGGLQPMFADGQPAPVFLGPEELCSGQFQVALVAVAPPGMENTGRVPDAETPNLFLLPFTWQDLLGHIYSHTENSQSKSSNHIQQFGDVRIDLPRHEVRRANQVVELTSLEFRVLKFFLFNPYRVISREEFLKAVWGYRWYPVTRSVDNQILRLRQKLEPEPAAPVHFQTVHGAGYKFAP
jgi:DNA-binding winged helix-turn-helix (wHTH) protein